ncbi:MAG: hypothetical protein ACQEQY_01010 [Halobacteriota archaeon]
MPSTPHLSAHLAVLVVSLVVTVVATRWAMIERGFPGAPLRWPAVFLRRVAAGFRAGGRETASWTGMGLYAVVVSVMHFGGIQYDIYTTLHWWDLLTHALSGFGVAVLLYLTFHRPATEPHSRRWLVPAVLAFGSGFEVYEFVFKDFWYRWTLEFYLVDTLVDLVAGVAGAAVFVGLVAGYRFLSVDRRGTVAD